MKTELVSDPILDRKLKIFLLDYGREGASRAIGKSDLASESTFVWKSFKDYSERFNKIVIAYFEVFPKNVYSDIFKEIENHFNHVIQASLDAFTMVLNHLLKEQDASLRTTLFVSVKTNLNHLKSDALNHLLVEIETIKQKRAYEEQNKPELTYFDSLLEYCKNNKPIARIMFLGVCIIGLYGVIDIIVKGVSAIFK